MKIISYQKFKNTHEYKSNKPKNTKRIYSAMSALGYTIIFQDSIEVGEKSINVISEILTYTDIPQGRVVYVRTKDNWGLPFLVLFYKKDGEI